VSVREARLCDSDGCDNPAKEACALCTLDRCNQHIGNSYIAIAVIVGNSGTPVINEFLGKSLAAAVCSECRALLMPHTTGVHVDANKMPLSDIVAPMRGTLIENASAFLSNERLVRSR